MKHFYYTVVTQYPDGKYISFVSSVSENQNILKHWNGKDGFGGEVITVQPCATKRYAEILRDAWNGDYLKNGTFHQF